MPGTKSNSRTDMFVNAQWALGGEGTGAPVHFHNTAWNALIYGAKRCQVLLFHRNCFPIYFLSFNF
jgi:hypothetical protein